MARSIQDAGRWRALALAAVSALGLVACGGTPANFEDSAKLPAKIAALEKTTPLPPGSTFDSELLQPSSGDTYEIGYWDNVVEQQAQCKWYMYWLTSRGAGDKTKMSSAETMFATMHKWHLYTSSDVSFQQLVDQIESKAQLGDPTGLQDYVRLNCSSIKP